MIYENIPRGLRNNNPLNIRHSQDRWRGARVEQTDKSFVQFSSMSYGYRAAWRVLASYRERFARDGIPLTPRTIIRRWAPPSENDTEAYLRTVCRMTGLGGNERLEWETLAGRERVVRLLKGMTCVECGISMAQVDEPSIQRGYEMALCGEP